MVDGDRLTVWERLREYAATQSGSFTSQEVLSWLRRHVTAESNDPTVRAHVRGACWNVEDRSQFAHREPFLTLVDRGLFKRATSDEIEQWRTEQSSGSTAHPLAVDGDGVEPNTASQASTESTPAAAVRLVEWHTEASVQASLVTALRADGWRIVREANTATKEHGIDVLASRDGQMVGIEVKGFPSRGYADPARANEVKRTSPSTQAGHWYSQAVLARYRALHAETVGSLTAAQIEVWWVDQQSLVSTAVTGFGGMPGQ